MLQNLSIQLITRSSKWSLFLTQYSAIILSVYILLSADLHPEYIWAILIGYILLSWIGISMIYHRKISHNSFKMSNILFYPGVMLGVLAGRGDPLGWAMEHRRHHLYADTDRDPHSSNNYKFKDIINPIKMKYGDTINLYVIRDLLKNPILRLISKYYNLIIIVMYSLCLFFPIIIYLWLIPMALTHIALNIFVYLSHRHGYKNYNLDDNSRNNWFVSLIFGGEGWENNHHYNENNPCFKKCWYEFDPVGALISIIQLKDNE